MFVFSCPVGVSTLCRLSCRNDGGQGNEEMRDVFFIRRRMRRFLSVLAGSVRCACSEKRN